MISLTPVRRYATFGLLGLALALSTARCDDPQAPDPDPAPSPVEPVAFEVEPEEIVLSALGEQHRLEVSATDEEGGPADPPAIEWASADPAVATVGAPGWVTAVANGETWVTATALGMTDSVRVVVEQQVARFELTPAFAVLRGIGGSSAPWTGRAVDSNGRPVPGHPVTSRRVLNPDVATIDEDGVVTARRDGQTTVALEFGDAGVGYGLVTVTARSATVTDWAVEHDAGSPLNAVWGASAADIFAVGDGGLILHFDGAGWRTLPSGHAGDLEDVWGLSGTDVYAAGSDVVLHYEGESWSTVLEGGPFRAVWGAAPDAVHVLEDAHRFDGDSWQPLAVLPIGPLDLPALQVLWGVSAEEVWGFGQGDVLTDHSRHESAIIGATQEDRWLAEATPVGGRTMYADIAGYGDRHLAVLDDSHDCQCVLEWREGEFLTLYTGFRDSNRALWGPHPQDLYLGGHNPFLDGVEDPEFPGPRSPGLQILHYDGTEWTRVHEEPGDDRVNGIWGTAVDDLIAVTEQGRVLRGRR